MFLFFDAIVLTPPFVVLIFPMLEGRQPKWWGACGALAILSVRLAAFLDTGFAWIGWNVLAVLACYGCYFAIWGASRRIRTLYLHKIAVWSAMIPIGAGLLLATAGAPVLLMIVADAATEPFHSEQIADNLTCRVKRWGFLLSDNGTKGGLYRKFSLLPAVEREIAWISVDNRNGVIVRSQNVEHPAPRKAREFCDQMAADIRASK
jgi:hypothetical protein